MTAVIFHLLQKYCIGSTLNTVAGQPD